MTTDHTQQSTGERAARVAEIRRQIAAGTYETPDRLEAAVNALLDDLEGRANPADGDPPPRRAK